MWLSGLLALALPLLPQDPVILSVLRMRDMLYELLRAVKAFWVPLGVEAGSAPRIGGSSYVFNVATERTLRAHAECYLVKPPCSL
jgi:hypothetical protein